MKHLTEAFFLTAGERLYCRDIRSKHHDISREALLVLHNQEEMSVDGKISKAIFSFCGILNAQFHSDAQYNRYKRKGHKRCEVANKVNPKKDDGDIRMSMSVSDCNAIMIVLLTFCPAFKTKELTCCPLRMNMLNHVRTLLLVPSSKPLT